jgi:hypothetical protein
MFKLGVFSDKPQFRPFYRDIFPETRPLIPSEDTVRKTLFVAAICFLAPIAIVVAMNPEGAQKSLKDAHAWALKTFPPPVEKAEPVQRC